MKTLGVSRNAVRLGRYGLCLGVAMAILAVTPQTAMAKRKIGKDLLPPEQKLEIKPKVFPSGPHPDEKKDKDKSKYVPL